VRQFGAIVTDLSTEIGSIGRGFAFTANGGPQSGSDKPRESVVRKAGQTPDFAEFNWLCQLNLQAGTAASLVLSFQAIGPRFRGFIGVVPYFVTQGAEPKLVDGMAFQINYEEDLASATARFSPWLDDVIVKGLNMWRQTL